MICYAGTNEYRARSGWPEDSLFFTGDQTDPEKHYFTLEVWENGKLCFGSQEISEIGIDGRASGWKRVQFQE